MRTELENEKARRLREMEEACKTTNLQQLDAKVSGDRNRRQEETQDRLAHIDYVVNNDFYTENPVYFGLMFRRRASRCWAGTVCCRITGKA
jgi:hypothetical protein